MNGDVAVGVTRIVFIAKAHTMRSAHSDDTLVIYMSDNGRPFPGAKTTLYDDGIHLPLIVCR